MRGFNVKEGNVVVGFVENYRKAVGVAEYWSKRDGTEVVVESPNGTPVYRVGGSAA